jgi:O-acetyl-ADP-ribose deacetylase (regulator of RNase III)
MAKFTTKNGNMFETKAQAIVNPVNCVGVMGAGLALQFKQKYPENYKYYLINCNKGEVKPGGMLVHATGLILPEFIINFPTKRHWRNPSQMGDIESGLLALKSAIEILRLKTVSIPALGCGLGGLLWEEVKPKIEKALGGIEDLEAFLFTF